MTCKYPVLAFLFLVFSCTTFASDQWTIVKEQTYGDLNIQLKISTRPSYYQAEWISLEIVNKSQQDLPIKNASYHLELKSYEHGGTKTLINERFRSSDFGKNNSINPLSKFISHKKIGSGRFSNGRSMSTQASTLLGNTLEAVIKVKALLSLQVEIEEDSDLNIEWPEVEFTFFWNPPTKQQQEQALLDLNQRLHQPQQSPYEDQWMSVLFSNPLAIDQLEVETLIKATQIRKGKEDGRLAIVQYLNAHFYSNKTLKEYYRKALFKKDLQAVKDLTIAPSIWDESYLEPIISWFQGAHSGVLQVMMEMLYVHRKDWIQKQGIATIFSDLIMYRYDDLMHKAHFELSDRELLVWSSAAQLLGKTGNPEIYEILLPYLKCQSPLPDGFSATSNIDQSIPGPMRVADIALEGLYELEGKNLEQIYLDTGFEKSPDSATRVKDITRIRDFLIQGFIDRERL